MLQKFKVKNFKNFSKELIYDLSQINNYEFNTEAISNGIVKNNLIYGKNGSGKTNLVYALMDITLHLTDNQKVEKHYQHYLNLENGADFAEFKYTFKFDQSICEYSYKKISYDELIEESLIINDELILNYSYENHFEPFLNLKGTESLKKDLGTKKISFLKYLFKNAIFDEDKNAHVIKMLEKYVDSMLMFNCLDGNTYQGLQVGAGSIAEYIVKNGKLEDFKRFLNAAGLSFNLISKNVDGEDFIFCDFNGRQANFFSVASKGTRALTLFYRWLIDFEKVSLVIVDEFDAFYHSDLARYIVKIALENKFQCIMTTHNTSIMDNDLLRPDCYYLIDDNKINSFSSLTDKELRKAHNIEKMYRAGAFDHD